MPGYSVLSLDALAIDALRQWEHCSSSHGETNKRYSRERLVELRVGEGVDRSANLLGKIVDTKPLLPSSKLSEINTVYTFNSFITDVPGDGDRGYHAIKKAAQVYGETMVIGTQFPKNSWETRQHLISFLRAKRDNIETAFVNTITETQPTKDATGVVSHILRNDIGCEGRDGTQPTFEEYCLGVAKSGFTGQWMGSLLGEIELHLLARSFGFMLFCVRAAKKNDEVLLRHEGAPFSFLWKDQMCYHPRGAIVFRFVGNEGGHFQIVNCDTTKKDMDLNLKGHAQNHAIRSARTQTIIEANEKVQADVDNLKKMNGVQLQTRKKYRANLRLITENSNL